MQPFSTVKSGTGSKIRHAGGVLIYFRFDHINKRPFATLFTIEKAHKKLADSNSYHFHRKLYGIKIMCLK